MRALRCLLGAVIVGVPACALVANIEDVTYRADDAGPLERDAGDAGASETSTDAAVDALDPCDLDRDGYRSVTCGGPDCDDEDDRAHPDAGFITDMPAARTNGDWNCDGEVTKQYPGMVECSVLPPPTQDCDAGAGFSGPEPACGQTGPFVSCFGAEPICRPTQPNVEMRVQGCR